MKIGILYDATPGHQTDLEAKGALDVLKDVETISDILRTDGFEIQPMGLDLPVIRKFGNLMDSKVDLVFNLCEGLGEESSFEIHVASLLELLGLPFTGTGPLGLALCHDKARAKELLSFHEISTPKHEVIEWGDAMNKKGLDYPLIVKPIHEDGSFGIEEDSVVSEDAQLKSKVRQIHQNFKQAAIVEEFIDGREFNVSILGNEPFLFTHIREIQFLSSRRPRIISFASKWKKSSLGYRTTIGTQVTDLSEKIKKLMLNAALQCFQIFKMRDYARIDFRMGKSQIPYVIDINPNPCISADSGMSMAAKDQGYSYEELIRRITFLALERNQILDRRALGTRSKKN
ncbi:MAG: ATP-grasp domain-containing protein [Chlamydiae bacterium]|nr:ATP-grasp domain-containing protein [Chlamydiota bacterium]